MCGLISSSLLTEQAKRKEKKKIPEASMIEKIMKTTSESAFFIFKFCFFKVNISLDICLVYIYNVAHPQKNINTLPIKIFTIKEVKSLNS